jgi:EmrB/QacA subfamily drug resistance transporter
MAAASMREKRLTLAAAVLGSSIVFLDATVIGIALPAIESDLGGGLAGQQWLTDAYLLALGSLLLIGGSLGDIFGQRRVFFIGVAGFGLTSMLCALPSSIALLCAFRAAQGVFAALLLPSTLAVIVRVFSPDERGRAIGSWTALSSVAGVIGPLVGGALIAAWSWRLIFVINVPLVLITLVLIARGVPRSAGEPIGGRVDSLGALLAAGALAGPVFALTEQPARGWDGIVIGSLLVGALAALSFVLHEARTKAPMLPLSLFRERNFTVGNAATLTTYLGLGGVIFLVPLFLQEVGRYTPIQAGLALLPVTILMIVLSRRFGALADRIGPRLPMGIGPIVAAAGMLLLLRVDRHADYFSQVLPGLAVFGLGLSMLVAPLTATVLGAVPQEHAGVASAVNNTLTRVANLVAVVVLGAVVAAAFSGHAEAAARASRLDPAGRAVVVRSERQPLGGADLESVPVGERSQVRTIVDDASVHAFHVAIAVAALLTAGGGLISLAGIRSPHRRVRAAECPAGALCGASRDLALTGKSQLFDRGFAGKPATAPP